MKYFNNKIWLSFVISIGLILPISEKKPFDLNGISPAYIKKWNFQESVFSKRAAYEQKEKLKYRKEVNGVMEFDVESFKKSAEIIITAMEIIVGNSKYPTPAIEENSHAFRPLGIGFANLGALLMSRGLAYDSDEGRNLAGSIMALLSGQSYYQSSKIAEKIGPFSGYKVNEQPMMEVMQMHRKEAYDINPEGVPADLLFEARKSWDNVVDHGLKHGIRNSQISVLAPTGTIAFLMDCDTTGVEPDIALVKYKWLVGGGMLKIVNNTIPEALQRLGYTQNQIDEILKLRKILLNLSLVFGCEWNRGEILIILPD